MGPKVYLPSTEHLPEDRQAWVQLSQEVTGGDFVAYNLATVDEIADVLLRGIVMWNLEEHLSAENLMRLPPADFWHIARARFEQKSDANMEKSVVRALTSGDQPAPWEFLIYRYRKIFGISWPEFIQTPLWVIQQDMLFAKLEAPFINKQE